MVSEANNKNISFADCAFSPKREELADHLTSYLELHNDGYVLNVDGHWGSGKSFFIKSWEKKLRENYKYPTCYIDAWTLDYLNNPLAVLSKKILESAGRSLKENSLLNPNEEAKVFEKLYKVLSMVGKFGAIALEHTISPTGGKILQEGIENLDTILIREGKANYELFQESENSLADFKNILTGYLSNFEKPLFIFVDELDRCRPDYTIELLEAIKHLFSLKNTIFIICTNRSEIEKSIRVIYGSDFNSSNYLSRFFDRSITIPSGDTKAYLDSNKTLDLILNKCEKATYIRAELNHIKIISEIINSFNIKLRETEKILDQTLLAVTSIKETKIFSLIILIFLFCAKENNHKEFRKLRLEKKIYANFLTNDHFRSEILEKLQNISSFSDSNLGGTEKLESYRLSDLIEVEIKFQIAISIMNSEVENHSSINAFRRKGNNNPYNDHLFHTLHEKITNERDYFLNFDEIFDLVDKSSGLK